MPDRDERMTQDAISEPERASRRGAAAGHSMRCVPAQREPLDEAEAALIAGGQDDDGQSGVTNEKCDVPNCPCMSQDPCSCVGHTHVLPLF